MSQRFLTYLLLFAFSVILVPRTIWHSHTKTKKVHSHDEDHDHSDADEDCYVCDFTLQPALEPLTFQFHFPSPDHYIAPGMALTLPEVREVSLLSLRGPPVYRDLCS